MSGKAWYELDDEAKQRIYQYHASRDISECLADSLIFKADGETNYAVLISTHSHKSYENGLEPWSCEIEVQVKDGEFQIVPLQKLEVAFPQENDFTRADSSDPEFVKALKARVKEAEAASDLAKQLFMGLIERAEEAEERAERAELRLAELDKQEKESEK